MHSSTVPYSIRVLGTMAAFVIVVAGVRAAAPIVVPFLLAIFLATICAQPLFWLQSKRIPSFLSVLIVVTGLIGLFALIGTVLGTSVGSFTAELPTYQSQLRNEFQSLLERMVASGLLPASTDLQEVFDPELAMQVVTNTLSAAGDVLTNSFLIIITIVFILLEMAGFPAKLRAALDAPEGSIAFFQRFSQTVLRYLALKTFVSLLTGVLATVWLFSLGVDFPILWGVVAFLLNYIPTIGSIIAAVPPVMVAIVQFNLGSGLIVGAGYMAINLIMGNFIEPRLMGRGVGLSTLVVFCSLVFWGWILGPIGMLLAVPLTMVLKIAFESNAELRWIAVLLGPESEARARLERGTVPGDGFVTALTPPPPSPAVSDAPPPQPTADPESA
ncbi:MAG: AI-2E family transporter [Bacteroidota bacterium]